MSTTETEQQRAEREIAALSAATYALPARDSEEYRAPGECDVIMKGGITSGVVYPLTICKLATRYRLRNIGGTSAGAIAAVMAAAAEYRRRSDPTAPEAGFQALAQLPHDISRRLVTLFQPMTSTRNVFEVAMAGLARGPRAALTGAVRHQPVWFVAGVLVVLGITVPALLLGVDWTAADRPGWQAIMLALILPLLLGIAVGLLAAVTAFAWKTLRLLPAVDFGLTDGATHSGDPDRPALTEWLADRIDAVAGLTEGCLTLGDLWGADGLQAWEDYLALGDRKAPILNEVKRRRDIDLETMTTDLTLRRPFRLPFRQQEFLFAESEMRRLFPKRVVATMQAGLPPSRYSHPDTGEQLFYFPGPGALSGAERRPGPGALPLVVMARMSLSFPGLISAVPLYAVDRNGDQKVVRHLFSDGGISSNFPMHFFDSLLPRRPTFGVNLAAPHPLYPDQMTWLPKVGRGGIISRAVPFSTVGGFASALRDTVQNWSDNAQITQRGNAERVVEIRLRDDEGGLNLDMEEDLIMRLVARGAEAGDLLLDFEWDAHRIVRYRTALIRLSEALDGLESAWADLDYAGLVDGYPVAEAPASSYVRGKAWRTKDLAATARLLEVVGAWREEDWPALREERPAPAPVVRLVPD